MFFGVNSHFIFCNMHSSKLYNKQLRAYKDARKFDRVLVGSDLGLEKVRRQ
jgi:hypothetical protein